jgi:hypothetical protein
MSKIILDLCGGTGAWGKPYEDAGYIVINVTLPFYDLLKTVIEGEYIIFQGGTKDPLKVRIIDIYGILAAPICTMFSKARTTAKTPILLLEDLIKTFSNKGDLVVDLTAGSGSTAVACINTKRNYILIEKKKKHYEFAKRRIKAIPGTLF